MRKKTKKTSKSDKEYMKEREQPTKHLIYLDVKGIRKEIKKPKKSKSVFMLLDREM
jgi:hypothetical protein